MCACSAVHCRDAHMFIMIEGVRINLKYWAPASGLGPGLRSARTCARESAGGGEGVACGAPSYLGGDADVAVLAAEEEHPADR